MKKARREKRQAQKRKNRNDTKPAEATGLGPGTVRAELPRRNLGPPGIPSELHAVALDRPSTPEEDKARLNDNREREFRVVVHLLTSIPLAAAAEDVSISFD